MRINDSAAAPIKLSELIDAFEFVGGSDLGEHQAYICRSTGRIIYVADGLDLEHDTVFTDDPELAEYEPVPQRRDLDLGKRLALSFIRGDLPGSFDKAKDIFSRKGAYRRFKQLLQATDTLDKWYAFEMQATRTALIEWCRSVGIPLLDNEGSA